MTSWVSKATEYSETESDTSILDFIEDVAVILTLARGFGLFQNASDGTGATSAGHLLSWSAMQYYKFWSYLDIKLVSGRLYKHQ